jgi:hypothetical protein
LQPYFAGLQALFVAIRRELECYSDGKNFKGDELVGWLGELYAKLLLGGTLVSDKFEHDVEADDKRVSVKARKGWSSGWTQSSAIPKIEGDDCPSHLMFLHFNDDYSLDRIWLYPWGELVSQGRFKPHMVRGSRRSFVFYVNPSADDAYLKYSGDRGVLEPPPPPPRVPHRSGGHKTLPWSSEQALFLKNRRRDMRLTQADVGKLTGIDRQRYSWIEYPKILSAPRRDELERIIRALKIDPSVFELEE